MTALVGVFSQGDKVLPIPGRAASLDTQTGVPALNCGREPITFLVGSKVVAGAISVAHWNLNGQINPLFCGILFEKVIIIPREEVLGFVLSTTTFPVEVWNTFQNSEKTLSSIDITGGSGISVSGGIGVPATFGPGRSSVYTVTVSQDGPGSIASVVTFNFLGGVTGADLSITGSRITVFSVEIDWSEGFDEAIEYRTAILKAYSTKEQRIQLRTKPRYAASYAVITTTPRETAALDAVVTSWQSRLFGVPWWMDESPLLANAVAGATVISVDTTSRPAFESGGIAMIWTDQFTFEALQVLTVSAGSIEFATQLAGNWTAGARVVPIKRGRMSEVFPVTRESSGVATFKASFECEVIQ